MAKRQKSPDTSLISTLSVLIEKNPELAARLAFEFGALIGQAVQASTAGGRLRKSGNGALRAVSKSIHDAPGALAKRLPDIPDLAKLTGLKFLSGSSPKLQPVKRTPPRRSKRARRAAA
jgi:hypothetical protein